MAQRQESEARSVGPQPTSPGTHADHPTEIPAQGWLAAAKRVGKSFKEDHITLTSAGVAFFGFLSLIPGLIAVVSVYGLFGDPNTVQQRVDDLAETLPGGARELIVEQLQAITSASGSALTIGLIVSVGGALWTASSGMSHLIEAINIVYEEDETRNFIKRRGLALLFTVGAIVFVLLAITAITVWPPVVSAIGPPSFLAWLLRLAVWPALAVALAFGLSILYRYAPNRADPEWRWATWGSGIAVLVWVLASVGFQVYAANFGSYNKTYGSLGAVVLLLMWLWITGIVTLLGAEINVQLEYQTTQDSTTGPDKPMGHRGAKAADEAVPA